MLNMFAFYEHHNLILILVSILWRLDGVTSIPPTLDEPLLPLMATPSTFELLFADIAPISFFGYIPLLTKNFAMYFVL
jgi:hypothetical protein